MVYLDNAASSQTPRQVLDAVARFYEADRANVHRGVHELRGISRPVEVFGLP